MANGNATIIIGSARLGSARLGRSIAPFFQRVKSYFILYQPSLRISRFCR